MSDQPRRPTWQTALLQRHQLGTAYLDSAQQWFYPLAQKLAAYQRVADRPILVAVNGCQGSGKTTLCDYLCTTLIEDQRLDSVALSLDDFYLTRTERQALAASVHPLLATRGVPGTHDMELLSATLAGLLGRNFDQPISIPRFDKVADDRLPIAAWTRIEAPVQVVLLEGWCLGASPAPADTLAGPVNALERDEDPQGQWRAYINEILEREFLTLYTLVDQWIMLCAPSFDCVFEWRREQERKLAATVPPEQAGDLMSDTALHRFIQHYERLTRHCLDALPANVDHLFILNEQREVMDYKPRRDAGASGRR